jgi:hypothetical protein
MKFPMLAHKIALVAFLATLAAPAATAGMVVTDPQSYSYFVEQLKKQADLVDKAAKQVETMGGVLDTANNIEAKMMGHYNRAMGIVNSVGRLEKAISQVGDGQNVFDTLKKWGNVGRAASGVIRGTAGEIGAAGGDYQVLTGDDLYVDTKKMLDWGFADPRNMDDPMAQYRSLDRKYAITQDALKNVIANSARTLGSMTDRVNNVKELAAQVDATTNMKDAQDLTNRLLVEIYNVLTEFLAITAQANQAMALANYSGVTDKAMSDRSKALESSTSGESSLSQLYKNGPSTTNGEDAILRAGKSQF